MWQKYTPHELQVKSSLVVPLGQKDQVINIQVTLFGVAHGYMKYSTKTSPGASRQGAPVPPSSASLLILSQLFSQKLNIENSSIKWGGHEKALRRATFWKWPKADKTLNIPTLQGWVYFNALERPLKRSKFSKHKHFLWKNIK